MVDTAIDSPRAGHSPARDGCSCCSLIFVGIPRCDIDGHRRGEEWIQDASSHYEYVQSQWVSYIAR